MKARLLKSLVVAVVSAIAVVEVVPRLTGSPWRAIIAPWSILTWWEVTLLLVVWFAGLVAYSSVLMGAMPGLTRRRALTLNLTGSAIANVLPLGGGFGIGMNWLMVRRWGFSPGQFSLLTILSNVWNVLAKAVLPCLAVVLLIVRDVPIDRRVLLGAVIVSAVLAATTAVVLVIGSSDRGARLAGRVTRAVAHATRSRRDGGDVEQRLRTLRHNGAHIVRAGWRRMTLGMIAYYALGALLMWASMRVVGGTLGPVAVLALFAFERAVTTLPITPGGTGVAEIATTALAIAFTGPGDKAVVAAGILLYRAFAFGLEIPVGGAWLIGWLLVQRAGRKADTGSGPLALGKAA
jgi:uncharacterized membrane protein YbhN (UPF0104 family)